MIRPAKSANTGAWAIVLLVVAISISPRITVGQIDTQRMLQLRFEDFLVLVIAFLWFLALCAKKEKIYISPIFKPIIIYVFLATVSTIIGIWAGWIAPVKSFFYYLKEVEYFLIFFLVINLVRSNEALKTVTWTLLLCFVANGLYCSYQVLSGQMWGYYGVTLIGEMNPFAVGGYSAMGLLLSLALFHAMRGRNIRIMSGLAILLNLITLLGSGSRANFIGATFAILILLVITVRRPVTVFGLPFAVSLILVIFIPFVQVLDYFHRVLPIIPRMSTKLIGSELWRVRIGWLYPLVLAKVKLNPVLGLGKSGIHQAVSEAHNHYLRVLLEMGILGLIAFLYLLASIVGKSYYVFKSCDFPLGKGVALGCLLSTISLMIAGLGQDAFIPVTVNEIFWILVGLTMVAYRLGSEIRLNMVSNGEFVESAREEKP